jgi:hypothetical protein
MLQTEQDKMSGHSLSETRICEFCDRVANVCVVDWYDHKLQKHRHVDVCYIHYYMKAGMKKANKIFLRT